ncbi:cation:proton antiporter [Streptomyces hiroshimensis]|uniref:Integral membrane ion exchanger n=1 Tax=Streptomyces hiroshimensis TaxID=66424 RepID=A0ABQ2Y4P3_9ACTN|nr:cation:proton antiporter [Streptomyces hiroshimensis]GGX64091.1 integral membrane ion exchanger [Streptomyces hiroshimensis]
MSPDAMLTHFVGAAAVVIVVAHGAGRLARWLRQPVIVGQLVAGIALGPTLLGAVAPAAARQLFPSEIEPMLNALSQLALIVFLFAVGYELDLSILKQRARTVVTVSLAAFLVPMATGTGAALLFRDELTRLGAPAGMPVSAVLFLGVALSITAVPVLTAIVRENGLAGTLPGVIAVSAAGLIDVMGWTVLVGALLDAGGHGGEPRGALQLVLGLLYAAVMLLGARPLLRRLLWGRHLDASYRLAVLVGFACASAWATSALGLHVIFGALLAGVVVPREADGTLDAELVRPLNDVSGLLLPFFFVISGSRVSVGSLNEAGLVALVVATSLAVLAKVGSGLGAARLCGVGRDDARTIGVLLSARGLTELIALNAGLQAGLITGRLYAVFVLMALVTTVATQPLLALVRWLAGRTRPPARDGGYGDSPDRAGPVTAPSPGSG